MRHTLKSRIQSHGSFLDKDSGRKAQFVRRILKWYNAHARQLPWRNTRDPYRILLSEVMLQQTQVSRVLQKYPMFLKSFPSFRSLAQARTSSVIRAWQGMGYNNRAVRLQRLAKQVVRVQRRRLPSDISQLELLPGIGKYTAHAIACFAFQQSVPVVDTNVFRVLRRVLPSAFSRLRTRPAQQKKAWDLALTLLPPARAYDWNQALMDLGSTICTVSSPRCGDCPVHTLCSSAFKSTRPRKRDRLSERGRDGSPNRIYRGRIVEVLRRLNGRRWVTKSTIGQRIKTNFGKRDQRWLNTLLLNLERDGLVVTKERGNETLVSLPR